MENPITADARGWRCACTHDFHDGYLLWVPPLLFAFDGSPSFASSMLAVLTVLLTAAVFWSAGRGRAESWVETLFAFGWMGVWAPASGLLLLDLGRGSDLGWLWAALCLASGAAVLAWSWRCRRRRPTRERDSTRRSLVAAEAAVWLVVGAVLLLFLAGESFLWADAAALALACILYLLLTPRGREVRPAGCR